MRFFIVPFFCPSLVILCKKPPTVPDHAVENGKSFFDVLFEPDKPSSALQQQQQPAKKPSQFHTQPTRDSTGGRNGDDEQYDEDDNEATKDKPRRSQIKDNVKGFIKSSLDNIKSVLPNRQHDQLEKSESSDSKRKSSTESPAYATQDSSKYDRFNTPSNTSVQEKQSRPYERLWETSSQDEGRR